MSKILPLNNKEPHPNPFGKLKLIIESRITLKSGWNPLGQVMLGAVGLDLTLLALVHPLIGNCTLQLACQFAQAYESPPSFKILHSWWAVSLEEE